MYPGPPEGGGLAPDVGGEGTNDPVLGGAPAAGSKELDLCASCGGGGPPPGRGRVAVFCVYGCGWGVVSPICGGKPP